MDLGHMRQTDAYKKIRKKCFGVSTSQSDSPLLSVSRQERVCFPNSLQWGLFSQWPNIINKKILDLVFERHPNAT